MHFRYGFSFNIFLIKIFLSLGHDRVVTIQSWNFSIQKFGVVWVSIDLPGVVIWQHIHPSMFYSFWEEGWQDSSYLTVYRPENSRVQAFFWYTREWGPGVLQTGNITLIATNLLYAWIGYLQVPIADNRRLSLLVHLPSLHPHSIGSIHLKLLSCWVESTHPFAARVNCWQPPLCPPTSLRWS